MQKQDILLKPIQITIDRIRQELLKIGYCDSLPALSGEASCFIAVARMR